MKSPKTLLSQLQHYRKLRQKRLPRSDLGKFFAYVIFLSYFTLLPYLLKMMWPYFIEKFDVVSFYVGSVFVVNVGIFVIYNSVLYVIYHIKHPFFQQYKNFDKAWPWEENPTEWIRLRNKTIKYNLINFFIISPIMIYFNVRSALPYKFSLQAWPSTFQILLQCSFFLLVQDIVFYIVHRSLHTPTFYWIHKSHHEHRQTVSVASHDVHPLEYIFEGTIPTSLGFQILTYFADVHYATVVVWFVFRIVQSYETHSGYTWSWNTLNLFPGTSGSDFHQYHHLANQGNFGSTFIIWDLMFGTAKSFVNYMEKQCEKKQQQQQQQKENGVQDREKVQVQTQVKVKASQ